MEQILMQALTGPAMIALVALLAANLCLSVVAAIAKRVFTFRKLSDFVPRRVLPLVGYIIVAALAEVVDGWNAVAIATYAGLVALYATGILAALRSLGLKLPDVVTEKEKK